MRLALLLGLAPTAIVFEQAANGQPPADAPLQCFLTASELTSISEEKAVELCTGATGDAPARCFAEANAQLAAPDAVRLCQYASSTEPAQCAANLLDSTPFDNISTVSYCAALQWWLVPPSASGSQECLAAGIDQTQLWEYNVLDLCAGSTSTDPVECFLIGSSRTTLSDGALIQLCRPYVLAAPSGSWAPAPSGY